ncbi:unnamed protein product [Prunus armeniaca]
MNGRETLKTVGTYRGLETEGGPASSRSSFFGRSSISDSSICEPRIIWFTNCTVFEGQAKVTASEGASSSSAEKMARAGSVCRPRFGAGSASRSTVNGLLPAALEEVPSVGGTRLGDGPASARADSACIWRRRSLSVRSSGSIPPEGAGAVPACRPFFFPCMPSMRRLFEDSFILFTSAAFLSSVTARRSRSDSSIYILNCQNGEVYLLSTGLTSWALMRLAVKRNFGYTLSTAGTFSLTLSICRISACVALGGFNLPAQNQMESALKEGKQDLQVLPNGRIAYR